MDAGREKGRNGGGARSGLTGGFGLAGRLRGTGRTREALVSLVDLALPLNYDARPPAATVRYDERPGRVRPPLADLYLPPVGGLVPSVVLVHGGGFTVGSRRMKPVRYLGTELARAGYAVASFDYRLLFRGGRLDDAVRDCSAMVRFWVGRSERLGLDPQRVHMLGLSAGATLMLLAAEEADASVRSYVGAFGMYDFTSMDRGPARLLGRLLLGTSQREDWAARSPLGRPLTPRPVTLLHGDADALVRVEQSRRLHALRLNAGLPSALIEYPGARHAFFNHPRTETARRATRDLLDALAGAAGPA